jgi:hypothetical protein
MRATVPYVQLWFPLGTDIRSACEVAVERFRRLGPVKFEVNGVDILVLGGDTPEYLYERYLQTSKALSELEAPPRYSCTPIEREFLDAHKDFVGALEGGKPTEAQATRLRNAIRKWEESERKDLE